MPNPVNGYPSYIKKVLQVAEARGELGSGDTRVKIRVANNAQERSQDYVLYPEHTIKKIAQKEETRKNSRLAKLSADNLRENFASFCPAYVFSVKDGHDLDAAYKDFSNACYQLVQNCGLGP